MKKIQGRAGGCGALSGEELERHLFVCGDCRSEARVSAAIHALRPGFDEADPPAADARFVSRVLELRRRGLARRRWIRLLAAAAAVLVFSFFTGTGSQGAAEQQRADEAFASLTASSAIDGLLPE